MRIQDVNLEIIKGNGVDLKVDVVAVGSVEDYPVDEESALISVDGEGHYYTVIASLFFEHSLHDVERVRQGYADVLAKSVELDARKLALIPFGCEKGIITTEASAKILAQELLKFLRFSNHNLETIYVCVTDTEHFEIVYNNVIGYLTHIQDTLGMGPYVTVDVIIERPEGVVIIERTNPPYGKALPGGFVDYGESLEDAVTREAKEETGLELKDLRQFGTYSDPGRDPRFHTVSTVYIARGEGGPKAGDDARSLTVLPYEALSGQEYAFDHGTMIRDYLKQREYET